MRFFFFSDDELPDYIMVMVANKKTSQQMTDDLSLFLGNNTIKFTTWYDPGLFSSWSFMLTLRCSGKAQAGVSDTDMIPILCPDTSMVSGKI